MAFSALGDFEIELVAGRVESAHACFCIQGKRRARYEVESAFARKKVEVASRRFCGRARVRVKGSERVQMHGQEDVTVRRNAFAVLAERSDD